MHINLKQFFLDCWYYLGIMHAPQSTGRKMDSFSLLSSKLMAGMNDVSNLCLISSSLSIPHSITKFHPIITSFPVYSHCLAPGLSSTPSKVLFPPFFPCCSSLLTPSWELAIKNITHSQSKILTAFYGRNVNSNFSGATSL